MRKKVNKSGLRSRKGMSVAEVAVALAVISIISGAAVSMAMHSVKVEANFVAVTQTKSSAESVLECFRFADSEEVFAQALQKLGAFEFKPEENAYVLEGKSVTVTVKASFSPKKLEYTAAKNSGETIYSYTFPVEGGASS